MAPPLGQHVVDAGAAGQLQASGGCQRVDHHRIHARFGAEHGPKQLRDVVTAVRCRQAVGEPGQGRAQRGLTGAADETAPGAGRRGGRFRPRAGRGGGGRVGGCGSGRRVRADPPQGDPALLQEGTAALGGAADQDFLSRVGRYTRLGHHHAPGALDDGRGRGDAFQVHDLRSQPGHHLGERQHLGPDALALALRRGIALHSLSMPRPYPACAQVGRPRRGRPDAVAALLLEARPTGQAPRVPARQQRPTRPRTPRNTR